jgi:predicted kinase
MTRPSPTLIVIHGPPASGKTLLSQWLAGQLDLPLVSKDAIKETLFEHFDHGSPEQSQRIDAASFDLLWMWLEAIMAAGERSCIVETAFDHASAEPALVRLVATHRYRVVQMFCHASEPILRQRYIDRAQSPERHPGHRDLELVEDQPIPEESSFRPLNLPGILMDLDTTDPDTIDAREVLHLLTHLLHSHNAD